MDQIPIFYRTIEDLQSSSLIMLESGNIYIGFIEIPREEWTIKKYNNYYYGETSLISISNPKWFPQKIYHSSIKEIKPISLIEREMLWENFSKIMKVFGLDEDVEEMIVGMNEIMTKEEIINNRYSIDLPNKLYNFFQKYCQKLSFKEILLRLWNFVETYDKEEQDKYFFYLVTTELRKYMEEKFDKAIEEWKNEQRNI